MEDQFNHRLIFNIVAKYVALAPVILLKENNSPKK